MIKQFKHDQEWHNWSRLRRKYIYTVLNEENEKEYVVVMSTHSREIEMEIVFQDNTKLKLKDVKGTKKLTKRYKFEELETFTKEDIKNIFNTISNQRALEIVSMSVESQIMHQISKSEKFDTHLCQCGGLDKFYLITGNQTITVHNRTYNNYTVEEMINNIDAEYITAEDVKLIFSIK